MRKFDEINRGLRWVGQELNIVKLFDHEIAYHNGTYHVLTPFGSEEMCTTPVGVMSMLNVTDDKTLDALLELRKNPSGYTHECSQLGTNLYRLRHHIPDTNSNKFAAAVLSQVVMPLLDIELDNLDADKLVEHVDESTLLMALKKFGWMVSDDAKVAMKFTDSGTLALFDAAEVAHG